MFQEFQRIGGIAERLQQALQPLVGFHVQVVEIRIRTLVEPVRRDACLGDSMHFGSANLHFDGRAVGSPQGVVQRLVAISLGDGDIVLEFSGDGIVETVQCTQRDVTGGHVFDNDAKAVDIEDLGECEILLHHFRVDTIELLFSPRHLGIQPCHFKTLLDRIQDFRDHFPAISAGRLGGVGQNTVTRREQVTEA